MWCLHPLMPATPSCCVLGGSRWLQCWGPHHPPGRPGWRSGLLAMAWCSPAVADIRGVSLQMKDLSTPSRSLCLASRGTCFETEGKRLLLSAVRILDPCWLSLHHPPRLPASRSGFPCVPVWRLAALTRKPNRRQNLVWVEAGMACALRPPDAHSPRTPPP